MILLSSSKYAEAMKKLREVQELVLNAVGAERTDDEKLSRADTGISSIFALLYPATDDHQ